MVLLLLKNKILFLELLSSFGFFCFVVFFKNISSSFEGIQICFSFPHPSILLAEI